MYTKVGSLLLCVCLSSLIPRQSENMESVSHLVSLFKCQPWSREGESVKLRKVRENHWSESKEKKKKEKKLFNSNQREKNICLRVSLSIKLHFKPRKTPTMVHNSLKLMNKTTPEQLCNHMHRYIMKTSYAFPITNFIIIMRILCAVCLMSLNQSLKLGHRITQFPMSPANE